MVALFRVLASPRLAGGPNILLSQRFFVVSLAAQWTSLGSVAAMLASPPGLLVLALLIAIAATSAAAQRLSPQPAGQEQPARGLVRRTRRSGTLASFASRTVASPELGYRSWLRVALVVVAVAHRRLGPSSSATTSTTDRALPSSAVQLRCWSRPTTRAAAYLPRPQWDRCRRSGHLRPRRSAVRRAGRLDVPEPHREPIQVPPERRQPGT